MKFTEIKEIAKQNNLEATLWQKGSVKRIYLNSYTGSGNRREEGTIKIAEDGTMEIDKRKNYTNAASKVWNAIDDKFEEEEK